MESLPLEIVCHIAYFLAKEDLYALGRIVQVNHSWYKLFNEAQLWRYLCSTLHPYFYRHFCQSIHIKEVFSEWEKEKEIEIAEIKEEEAEEKEEIGEIKEEVEEGKSVIQWRSKYLEWILLDEVVDISSCFFKENLEKRMSAAQIVSAICKSKFVDIKVLLEFVRSPRSDLRVAAGIGFAAKLEQLSVEQPLFKLKNKKKEEEFPFSYIAGGPNSVRNVNIANCTAGLHPSFVLLEIQLLELLDNIIAGTVPNITDVDPLLASFIDGIETLMLDGSSRVVYRAFEAIKKNKALALLMRGKLERIMETQNNPVITEFAQEVLADIAKANK